jgi:two-component system OmpR family response regulator
MVSGSEKDRRVGQDSVLVFDEETAVLDFIALALSRAGYQVTSTRRREEALKLFSGRTFDLAIADLGLHNGNGRRLVLEIKATSPETAVVSMAAYPAGEIEDFAEQHTEAFLAKPFDISELLGAVRTVLGRRSAKESGSDRTSVSRQNMPAVVS